MKKNSITKTLSRLSNKTTSFIRNVKLPEHTFMILLAIIIGVTAGFGAVGIRLLIKFVSNLSFRGNGNNLENILHTSWYWIIIIPTLGGIIVGPIIYFFAQEAKGHGVPEVMQAILVNRGRIRPRVAFIKTIASAITIGTGGSVGREGPIIQIGSSLGSTIGQFVHVPARKLKTLVGCGAAAGIAAAFNTPIAGALFAVEIILMDFAVAQFSPIVISSVMATVISHIFEGNLSSFEVPAYQLVSPLEILFYFILGILCGLISFAFIKLLYYSEDLFDTKLKLPDYLKPALGGLIIGAIGLMFPNVLGLGYESINIALRGEMIWHIALTLILIKMIATSITLGSGGSGGIFTPSLFMGAMTGYFYGSFVHYLLPGITGAQNAYALVAMGGLVAGATRAPITAIIIVFELTNDYNIILPLMVTCIISTIVSSRYCKESIYTLKLLLRHVNIREGGEENIMSSILVKDVYSPKFGTIEVDDNLSKIMNKFIKGNKGEYPVVNSRNEIFGLISIEDIKEHMQDEQSLQNILIAGDIARTDFKMINEEANCKTALQIMTKYDYEGIPVHNDRDPKKVIGMLWRKDLHYAFLKEAEAREISSSLASSILMKDSNNQQIRFWEGYSVIELKPPKSFHGKSIKELNLRTKYGVDVLAIKSHRKGTLKVSAIPDPNQVITSTDILVIAGENKNLILLKETE